MLASLFICVHLCVGICTGALTIWQMVVLDKEIFLSSVWLHSAQTCSLTPIYDSLLLYARDASVSCGCDDGWPFQPATNKT